MEPLIIWIMKKHTFQMALEVHTFQMALEVHTFQMALEVHTFQMAQEVHTLEHPLTVASNLSLKPTIDWYIKSTTGASSLSLEPFIK
jgi:hypothetical protein